MEANTENELYEIMRRLGTAAAILNDVAYNVQRYSKGVGGERCAYSITSIANQITNIKRRLENMDTETVTEGFVPPEGA